MPSVPLTTLENTLASTNVPPKSPSEFVFNVLSVVSNAPLSIAVVTFATLPIMFALVPASLTLKYSLRSNTN